MSDNSTIFICEFFADEKIEFGVVVPVAWALASLLYGLFYITAMMSESVTALVCLIVLPVLFLLSTALYLWIKEKKRRIQLQNELALKSGTKEKCLKWIKQFSFVDESNSDLQIYISKGRPTGRLTIQSLTTEQIYEIESRSNELPMGVKLLLIPKDT
ncbi:MULTISPECIES: hypothetical protein [Brevibacillus]|uniref:hypothetical protein n=1 Tax=Brevibacillus TaxID=55080 RepID=UPI0015EFB991|nr:hypothetical protein [Brevibacillus halotolerans]MBA4533887.1 hypothetical protein [Brevibacillus halotolerans]